MTVLIVLLYAFGLTLLFFPQIWWQLTDAKKYAEETPPTQKYLHGARLLGGLLTLATTVLLIVQLFR